jgi:hypothetical protein
MTGRPIICPYCDGEETEKVGRDHHYCPDCERFIRLVNDQWRVYLTTDDEVRFINAKASVWANDRESLGLRFIEGTFIFDDGIDRYECHEAYDGVWFDPKKPL